MERGELRLSQYAPCSIRRFLIADEPEAEQRNTRSFTDIGRLAEQARTELRSAIAYRKEGGDLDRCRRPAQIVRSQCDLKEVEGERRRLAPMAETEMAQSQIDVDQLVLVQVEADASQWLQRVDSLVVLTSAYRDPALRQAGQRTQPVVLLGARNLGGNACACLCLLDTPLMRIPQRKMGTGTALRPPIAQPARQRNRIGETQLDGRILHIELEHAAA